jgi:hypothetical protein
VVVDSFGGCGGVARGGVFFFFFSFGFWVSDARGGLSGSWWLWWHGVTMELERRLDMAGGFC